MLVRAADVSLAEERVREVAITAGWWQQSALCRIEVWIGNLAESRLGLQQEKWAEILNMDIIIHNGAVVNYSAGYNVLERANVMSTFHLLEAALQSQISAPSSISLAALNKARANQTQSICGPLMESI